jgi:hypothetical protein
VQPLLADVPHESAHVVDVVVERERALVERHHAASIQSVT